LKLVGSLEGPPSEVQNFYRLLATLDIKLHDATDVTVLQTVTRPMAMKLKYNFSNQCYNDVAKLITDFILAKHNMSKDLYQYKKIVFGLDINYEKIDVCEKNACCSGRSTRTTSNVCIVLGLDTLRW
jgi:hypothetical protein